MTIDLTVLFYVAVFVISGVLGWFWQDYLTRRKNRRAQEEIINLHNEIIAEMQRSLKPQPLIGREAILLELMRNQQNQPKRTH